MFRILGPIGPNGSFCAIMQNALFLADFTMYSVFSLSNKCYDNGTFGVFVNFGQYGPFYEN